ncbi:ARS binding protein 2-domain-containing protein [Immersiella caudata]|uniref:ARS binding protein 2-domain-containing protein n=1 Tax=Immersiella caudata TaxID=314043 RepID=A0AA39X432_9PEZI|nr:ARS binding protein 2-domain-containing protein [Immersiella caudata]
MFTASPTTIEPPSARLPSRSLPSRNITSSTIEDAYVAFVFYCNPAVPLDTETAALREAFRTPPKSGGKSFSTYTLFELIKQLETKELKTWAELALKLGVEPPDQEKGQSSQKIQQYAVRLKRWMHSMHVDAFFEYLMDRPHPYWNELPPASTPVIETGRDGVAAEDDMALRALLPQIKPRRGRKKPEDDETGKSPSQRPSPLQDEYPPSARPDASEPWSAHPDGRGSVFLFPSAPDPMRLSASMGQPPSQPWIGNDVAQTPLTAYPHPQSALTPITRNAFWADPSEPRSAITASKPRSTSRRHAPPALPPQILNQPSPVQENAPPRPAKRSRLSLQVPERVGGEVRLATPPLPMTAPPTAPPVVMVNGQAHDHSSIHPTSSSAHDPMMHHQHHQHNHNQHPHQHQHLEQQPGTTGPPGAANHAHGVDDLFEQHSRTSAMPPGAGGIPQVALQDLSDRTNIEEVEDFFAHTIITGQWFDSLGVPIPAGSYDEAMALAQTVIENLIRTAATKEAFLINLSALTGGKMLMPKDSLRITRLETPAEMVDRSRYLCQWELRYGDIQGTYSMEETVLHSKWKKGKKDAGPEEGVAEREEAERWQTMYREIMDVMARRDADSTTTTMPKQYVLLGRPVPRIGTRHASLLLVGLSLFALFSLLFTLPSALPAGPSFDNPKFSIPKSLKKQPWMNHLNPFKQPAHAPPRQNNDTDGEASCSTVTMDEGRSLLPIQERRPRIYCYYDNTVDKPPKDKDAESELLLAWRKAWWAYGFEPILLTPAEGETNPFLRNDLMRWLAWENMGGGLLAHFLLYPMGPYDDPLLKSLRRGEYPKLTRWKDLDDGLFAGPKNEILSTVKLAMASPHLKVVKDLVAAITHDKAENPFAVDDPPASLAYYSAKVIETKYTKVGDELAINKPAGLNSLRKLITAHLHVTWQSSYPAGIAVVKPIPHHTTHLIRPAFHLATRLTRCPDSPIPSSCPPNRPDCATCDPGRLLPVSTPAHLSTAKDRFTIGIVPHPYTTSSLIALRDDIDISFIRATLDRDPWITDLTQDVCTAGISGGARLLRFKEAVAADESGARASLWLLAEREIPEDLDWHFGFPIPGGGGGDPPNHDPADGPIPVPEELALEPALLTHAQAIVGTNDPTLKRKPKKLATAEEIAIRDATEAWNLADAEAWRFARAYLARKAMERKKWELEEEKFADGMGSETGRRSPWDRWLE